MANDKNDDMNQRPYFEHEKNEEPPEGTPSLPEGMQEPTLVGILADADPKAISDFENWWYGPPNPILYPSGFPVAGKSGYGSMPTPYEWWRRNPYQAEAHDAALEAWCSAIAASGSMPPLFFPYLPIPNRPTSFPLYPQSGMVFGATPGPATPPFHAVIRGFGFASPAGAVTRVSFGTQGGASEVNAISFVVLNNTTIAVVVPPLAADPTAPTAVDVNVYHARIPAPGVMTIPAASGGFTYLPRPTS
jgi:hypothetical protein